MRDLDALGAVAFEGYSFALVDCFGWFVLLGDRFAKKDVFE